MLGISIDNLQTNTSISTHAHPDPLERFKAWAFEGILGVSESYNESLSNLKQHLETQNKRQGTQMLPLVHE